MSFQSNYIFGSKMKACCPISNPEPFSLSDGEIYFLWWFIQGSIMSPMTRERLWNGWGMCERHAWAFIVVETAFRGDYLMGPAILYEDLMHRASFKFSNRGLLKPWRVQKGLNERGPCMMCEMKYGPNSRSAAGPELLEKGRDLYEIQTFAKKTYRYWGKTVCGRCAGNSSIHRCRHHLIESISKGRINDLSLHEKLVNHIARHIKTYMLSFRWENRGMETVEDMAALISAVGWCSGWKPLFSIMA
jgi:hypothetical protein